MSRFDVASLFAVLGKVRKELPEELYVAQELIEALPIPVFFKGRDGLYLGVNKAWEEFFGVPRETFLGKEVRELYPQSPWVAEKHFAMDQELWEHPGKQSYEIPVTTRDGSVRHTLYYKATFTRGDGEVAGLIGTIVDITERKRAELRQLIEHEVSRSLAESGTLAVAIRGIIRMMCAHLGFACGARWSLDEKDQVLHCIESWGIPDPRVAAFLEASRRNTYVPGTNGLIRRVLSTGAPVWVDDVTQKKDFLRATVAAEAGLRGAFALPVLIEDKVLGAIEFYSQGAAKHDEWLLQLAATVGNQIGQLMARRQAEAALREAHDALERKARELARSNEELQQFAYVASHDLQEPLRMISSYTQLLMRRYGSKLDQDAKEFTDFIVDGATRMKQLIEDLLAYSRVGTRGREFRPADCESVLYKALANLRAAIEASGAVITHDPLPSVIADDSQLAQLLQNLIGNAIKFKGAQAPLIHISAQEQTEEWLFTIKDNGIGIDPQYFERIFVLFQRLHSKAEYPGTGIGLAICKKIVDRHGGRIRVESQPGHGCAFYFTLPKNPGEAGS